MHRNDILLLALALTPLLAASPPESAPVIHLSIYAPAQNDPPVRIVGFGDDKDELQFLLANASDKPVVAVVIVRIDIAPPGCTLEPERGTEAWRFVKSVHPGAYHVSIPPHGRSIADREGIYMVGTPRPSPAYPHWPRSMVRSAKSARTGYMQFQFGVTGVLFEDGTTWPNGIAFLLRHDFDASKLRPAKSPQEDAKEHAVLHPQLFDPALVEAEAERCLDVTSAANALQSVTETVFERDVAHSPESEEDKNPPPHPHFSCVLQGPKAVCHMPVEGAPSVQPPSGSQGSK